jgi:hypothetical protein
MTCTAWLFEECWSIDFGTSLRIFSSREQKQGTKCLRRCSDAEPFRTISLWRISDVRVLAW